MGQRTCNAKVAEGVKRRKVHHARQILILVLVVPVSGPRVVGLVEAPKPNELEDLLREEEAGDEIGLRGEEGDVRVVYLLHVGVAEHAVILGGKVDGEGERREPLGRGEGDAHCLFVGWK